MSLTLSTPQAASVSSTQQVSSLQQGWGLEGQCHSCDAVHWLLLPLSGLFNAGHLFALSETEQRVPYGREKHVSLRFCRMSRGYKLSTLCPRSLLSATAATRGLKSLARAQLSMRRSRPAQFTALPSSTRAVRVVRSPTLAPRRPTGRGNQGFPGAAPVRDDARTRAKT